MLKGSLIVLGIMMICGAMRLPHLNSDGVAIMVGAIMVAIGVLR